VHRQSRIRGEQWTLGVDWNGTLAEGATIDSGIFRVMNPAVVIFGAATKNARDCSIICTAGYGEGTVIKCQITDSTGAVWNQIFTVGVSGLPWFLGETAQPQGAYSVNLP
jgi:hypothetical protein